MLCEVFFYWIDYKSNVCLTYKENNTADIKVSFGMLRSVKWGAYN